ncbi:MAG: hypothetical protein HKO66_15695 [Saprospiraceae bacterium]|nr:hypothetical protein [Saprospiraceae bacterium]
MSLANSIPNPKNLQGLILRGFTHPYSCHLLFGFSNGDVTKNFFSDIFDKIQSAEDWGNQKPKSMINIGLTFGGIKKLSVIDENDLNNFAGTFINGPSAAAAQQSLGDWYDPNSKPETWWNGNTEAQVNLDCVVHVYGLTKDDLDKLVSDISTSANKNKLTEYYALKDDKRLYQSILGDDPSKIHFGYVDGISNPSLKNSGFSGLASPEDINNFVIGYGNNSISNSGPFDESTAADFAKDGCYNAFRIFHQDVNTFNQFLKTQAKKYSTKLSFLGLNETELEEWFAAKLCGRWRNGSPIMLNPNKPSDSNERNIKAENFGFEELTKQIPEDVLKKFPSKASESSGSICPFSAHTRVANPRNQQLNTAREGTSGPPRILRRGMAYGPDLTSSKDDGKERGLIGLFLCGNLTTQFELLYGWMNFNDFSQPPVFSTVKTPQDALLGNRYYADANNAVKSFIIPVKDPNNKSVDITIPELPSFLAIRGTAYCLLPSISTLAKIAGKK